MNGKTFLYIFAGVIAAGLICLGVGLAVHYSVSGNPIVTIVSLFAIIAGAIMAGIGLFSLLICLLIMVFGRGNKNRAAEEGTEAEGAEEAAVSTEENGEKTEEVEGVSGDEGAANEDGDGTEN